MPTTDRSAAPQILQSFAQRYANEQTAYKWNEIFAPVPVNKRSGKFKSIGSGLSFGDQTRADSIREALASFPEVSYTISNTDGWFLREEGYKAAADKMDIAESAEDGLDEQEVAVATAVDALNIAMERQAYALVDAVSSTTLSGSDQWNATGSDPRNQADAAADAFAAALGGADRSNIHLICRPTVWTDLKKHTAAMTYFRTGELGGRQSLNEAQAAAWLEIGSVIVPRATYNSADEGQTASNGYVWTGDDVTFFYAPPSPMALRPNMAFADFQKLGRPQGAVEQMDVGFRGVEYLVSYYHHMMVANSDAILRYDDVLA
jgi:hypothetical protein